MTKVFLEAHRTDVAVISDVTRIYRAAPVIEDGVENSQLLRLVSERLLGGTQRREELLEALRQGGGADVVIVQPHGCESQDSQFWIPADHRNVVIEAPGMISPWQTDMSDLVLQ